MVISTDVSQVGLTLFSSFLFFYYRFTFPAFSFISISFLNMYMYNLLQRLFKVFIGFSHYFYSCIRDIHSTMPFFPLCDISNYKIRERKGKTLTTNWRDLRRKDPWKHMETDSKVTDVFLNQKRVNVCEHPTKMASLESFWKVPPGACKRMGWREI